MPVSLRLGSLGLLLLCACAPVIAQPSRAPGAVLGTSAPTTPPAPVAAQPQPSPSTQLQPQAVTEVLLTDLALQLTLALQLVECVQGPKLIQCEFLLTNRSRNAFDVALVNLNTRLIDMQGNVVIVEEMSMGVKTTDTKDGYGARLNEMLPAGVPLRLKARFPYNTPVDMLAAVEISTSLGPATFIRVKVTPAKP